MPIPASAKLIHEHYGTFGRFMHYIRRRYVCDVADVVTLVEYLRTYVETWGNAQDQLTCRETIGRTREAPDGKCEVEVLFRTRTVDEWLQANVNRLRVYRRPIQTAQPLEYDLTTPTAQKIEGFDDSNPFRWWRIKEGENFNIRPKEAIVLRGYTDSLTTYVNPLDGVVNQVNSADLTSIHPDGTAGNLLYLNKRVEPVTYNDLWAVEYYLMYHGDGWNSQCVTEQWGNEQRRVGALKEDGTALPSSAYRIVTVPTRIADSETACVLFETGTDFNLLNTMVAGS